MAIMLTSSLATHIKDENGVRHSVPLKNINKIVSNIKKYVKKFDKVVYVANNPNSYEENDERKNTTFESLDKSGFVFKEKILLDGRNSEKAKQILQNANLVILCGGKCLCQLNFFNQINLKEILKNFDGLVIGISAGTMNLCKTVANFPEEECDLPEPRWLEGLGFYDKIVIPHFDGENLKYQIECEIDLVKDWILPMSFKEPFIGIPNDSYILIDGNKIKFYGNMYLIDAGKVSKI